MTEPETRPTGSTGSPSLVLDVPARVPAGGRSVAGPGRWWVTLAGFLVVALAVWLVVWLSAAHLSRTDLYPRPLDVPGGMWFEGWARWDAYWYRSIVDEGYVYYSGIQSSVAYFPAYPAVLWVMQHAFSSVFVAGSVVTLAAGASAVVTFRRWVGLFVSRPVAMTAVALLVLYPFSWYLFGAIYADALFVAVTIGAFFALERDRLWLVALLGTVAAVSRPTGLAVVLGLVLRLLELRNPGARRWRSRLDPRSLRGRDHLAFAGFAGFAGWVIYLGVRFGDPFAFATVQGAPGWDQPEGFSTWFKFAFFRNLFTNIGSDSTLSQVLQATLAAIALALIVVVRKRLGWGYAGYCLAVLALPLIGSKDFMGVGRYLLPAFPVFAAAGLVLADRPRTRIGVLVVSGTLLVTMSSFFARGYYLA